MAGSKIYLGEILGQLKQDTQDYSVTLQTMIAELKNVQKAISASIYVVNVKASNSLKKSLTHEALTSTEDSANPVPLIKFFSFLNGTIKIQLDTSWEGSYTSRDMYVKNDTIPIVVTKNVNSGRHYFEIPSKPGSIIEIGSRGNNSEGRITILQNSIKISYDIVDIVNETGIERFQNVER